MLIGKCDMKESSECVESEDECESSGTDYSSIEDCKCHGCNKPLGYCDEEWFTCTICMTEGHEYGTSMSICAACVESGFHNEHADQTARFHPYPPEYDGGWCDACGVVLDDPQRLIYVCKKCEKKDVDYGLCSKCYKKHLHSKHKEYMKKQNMLLC